MRRVLISATAGVVGGIPLQLMASAYSSAVLSLAPNAYWRMQDTSGVGTDQVGNAHPLNNFNGITRGTAGPSLPGMELNELSYGFSGGSGADTSNTPYVPVTGTGARTEILWAQETTSVAALGGTQNLSEYGVYSGSANQFTAFSLGIDSGFDYVNGGGPVGYDVFTLNIQGRQVEATTTPIVPGTWYMLAAVFPNGLTTLGDAQLYVNGVRQGLIDDTAVVPSTATGPDALPFRVGQWRGGYGLNGDETETSFFNNALSGSQIQGLYDVAEGLPSPVSWNNTGGTGNGVTWDTASQNWNAFGPAKYTNGIGVTFDDTNNGHYAVTLSSIVSPSSVTFNNSAGNYGISGTGSIGGSGSLAKNGTGTVTLSTANTYSGGTTVNAGTLVIAPTATPATTSALGAGPLTINSALVTLSTNATLGSQKTPTPSSSISITSLAITGTGQLDLNNNHIIINYGAGADPIASIVALIKSGYNGGLWTGNGIMSTAAQSNAGSYGIGYADSADPGNPAGLASGQIEIEYTLLGDANLDGAVNGSDFAILATNFNKAVSGWDAGDFNYDGAANGSDFAALASNFNKGSSQAADSTAIGTNSLLTNVPEPASLGLLLSGATGLLGRRRCRRFQT